MQIPRNNHNNPVNSIKGKLARGDNDYTGNLVYAGGRVQRTEAQDNRLRIRRRAELDAQYLL